MVRSKKLNRKPRVPATTIGGQGKIKNRKLPPADFLFEIGTEELPAAYVPGLINQFTKEADILFKERHLTFKSIEGYATPRRLILIVRKLDASVHKPAEAIRGPSKQVAFDPAGKPTKALLGFLRSQKATLKQLEIRSLGNKGNYTFIVTAPKATPTHAVLPGLLKELVNRLRAPKSMRWDASNQRFARPIRWLIALYAKKPIRLSVGNIKSAMLTKIGRPQCLRSISISSIDAYLNTLRKAGIIIDQNARRSKIEQLVTQTAKRLGGVTAPEMVSHGLLEEVTYLVEQPVVLVGSFDTKYLELPREVLLASMAKYQRVFAIEKKSSPGTLIPKFIAILDGKPHRFDGVRKVAERILNARLSDSLILLGEDRKQLPFAKMAKTLSQVAFHEGLGSMADKTERISKLRTVLEKAWKLSKDENDALNSACQFAKADLVSSMVKEFPTLQGIMGKYYATDSKESELAAYAIGEHYLPLAGKLPNSIVGSALGILDKYDTLASYFSIGIKPTGDQDPYALRRAAQGIVEVAWKIHRPLPLGGLLDARSALSYWGPKANSQSNPSTESIGKMIQSYLLDRLYSFNWSKPVPSVDCIDAVLSTFKEKRCDDLVDVMDRIVSLAMLNGHSGLLKAAKVVERTRNILRGANLKQSNVDPSRLAEAPERQLWDVCQANEKKFLDLTRQQSYSEATTLFGEVFWEPLDTFFDQVMVNVPEESIQQNRLALMKTIHTLYTDRIADLSKLTILQNEEPTK